MPQRTFELFAEPGALSGTPMLEIAARLAGLRLRVRTGGAPASATQQLPQLATADGPVTGAAAVLRFLAALCPAAGLQGEGDFDAAAVDDFVGRAVDDIEVAAGVLALTHGSPPEANAQQLGPHWRTCVRSARADALRELAALERHLLHRTYLVGDAVTAADVATVCAVAPLFAGGLGAAELQPFVCVGRWWRTCVRRPAFAAVLGAPADVAAPLKPSVDEAALDALDVRRGTVTAVRGSSARVDFGAVVGVRVVAGVGLARLVEGQEVWCVVNCGRNARLLQ